MENEKRAAQRFHLGFIKSPNLERFKGDSAVESFVNPLTELQFNERGHVIAARGDIHLGDYNCTFTMIYDIKSGVAVFKMRSLVNH